MSGLRAAAVCGATTPCDALALAPQVDGAAAGVAAGAVAPADDDDDANDAADADDDDDATPKIKPSKLTPP